LTARQVADVLGVSYDLVREHRHELGVLAGQGARPRLLFHAAAVDRYVTARHEAAAVEAAKLGIPLEVEPDQILRNAAQVAASIAEHLRRRVLDLNDEDTLQGGE